MKKLKIMYSFFVLILIILFFAFCAMPEGKISKKNNSTSSVVSSISSLSSSSSSLFNDDIAPMMMSIIAVPDNLEETNTILVSIEAHDNANGSGIKSITAVIESPTEQSLGGGIYPLIDLTFNYNNATSNWEANAIFDDNPEPGYWMINNIILEDNAGNRRKYHRVSEESTEYYYDTYDEGISNIKFVTIFVPDTNPPVLLSVNANPVTFSSQGNVTITIKADDDSHEVANVTAQLRAPKFDTGFNGQIINVNLSYNSSNDSWIGTASIRSDHENGTWYIDKIRLEDPSGNWVIYERNNNESMTNYVHYDENDEEWKDTGVPLKSISINITANKDTTPPSLTGVSRSPSTITGSGTITFTINASDISGTYYSGTKAVSATLFSPTAVSSNGEEGDIITFNLTGGPPNWTGNVTLQNSDETGKWILKYITLIDNSGNFRTYYYPETGNYYMYSDRVDGSSPSDSPVLKTNGEITKN